MGKVLTASLLDNIRHPAISRRCSEALNRLDSSCAQKRPWHEASLLQLEWMSFVIPLGNWRGKLWSSLTRKRSCCPCKADFYRILRKLACPNSWWYLKWLNVPLVSGIMQVILPWASNQNLNAREMLNQLRPWRSTSTVSTRVSNSPVRHCLAAKIGHRGYLSVPKTTQT